MASDDQQLRFEPCAKRIRGIANDTMIVDSLRAVLERDEFRRSRLGIPDSGHFVIQDAGWNQDASMDGETVFDGSAGTCGSGC